MTRRRLLIALAILAVTTLLVYAIGSTGSRGRANPLAGLLSSIGITNSDGAGSMIRVSGNVELTDADVSFKLPGRVRERRKDEGETVRQDEVVAVLESADLEKEVALREADVRAVQAAWEELDNGSRKEEIEAARAAMLKARYFLDELEHGSRKQEIDAARAALDAAKAEKERLSSELARAQDLFRRQVLAEEDYLRQRAAYDVADAKWREASQRYDLVVAGPRDEQKQQAKAALDQASFQYQLVEKGARQEVRDQAKARLDQARAALELAKVRLGYATVVSPLTGVVLSKNVEPGEYVSPGTPVITVGDLARPWLRAYIDYDESKQVKPGQKAKVYVGGKRATAYEGWVGFIASEAEFTPKNVQTEKERTRLVYRIKIYFDNHDLEAKRGVPADAEILLDSAAPAAPPAR